MYENFIKLDKPRDFSDTISDAFTFLRDEFKPLVKTILIYVGPVILITGFFEAWYVQSIGNIISPPVNGDPMSSMFSVLAQKISFQYILLSIGNTTSSILLVITVLSHMKLYKKFGSGNFESSDVWKEIKHNFFVILSGYLIIGIVFALMVVILVAFIKILPAVSIILSMALLFAIIYFSVYLSLFSGVVVFEQKTVINAFKRSAYLVKNYWWFTLGVLFISYLIASIGQTAVKFPQLLFSASKIYASNEASNGGSLMLTVFMVIGTFLSYFLYAIPFATIGIHYYSQREKKENKDLIDRISKI